ncbi:MAG: cation:proton antiporter [Gammaproteobacteria bacterium]|nr:cation:proton antiporter [Gammaproteobacteria bacterium]
MTGINLNMADMVVILLMGSGLILSLWRFLLGPNAPDRIVAADTLSIIITASLVLMSFWFDNPMYLDVALIYGVLAFIGVVALARAIEKGQS